MAEGDHYVSKTEMYVDIATGGAAALLLTALPVGFVVGAYIALRRLFF